MNSPEISIVYARIKQFISYFLATFVAASSYAIVNGEQADIKDFPATVFFWKDASSRSSCTAHKVGERLFLTSFSCMANGTNALSLHRGQIALYQNTDQQHPSELSDLTSVYKVATITGLRVFPKMLQEFEKGTRNDKNALAKLWKKFPDVAVFEIDQETPEVPVAKIDVNWTTTDSDEVIIAGWGRQKDQYSKSSPATPSNPYILRSAKVKPKDVGPGQSIDGYNHESYFTIETNEKTMPRPTLGDEGTALYSTQANKDGQYLTILGILTNAQKINSKENFRSPLVAKFNTNREFSDWLESAVSSGYIQDGVKSVASYQLPNGEVLEIHSRMFEHTNMPRECISVGNLAADQSFKEQDHDKFLSLAGTDRQLTIFSYGDLQSVVDEPRIFDTVFEVRQKLLSIEYVVESRLPQPIQNYQAPNSGGKTSVKYLTSKYLFKKFNVAYERPEKGETVEQLLRYCYY